MKKGVRFTWTCVAVAAALSAAWLFHGCGGGGGGTTPSASTESATVPVFTNSSGATTKETKTSTPSSSATIPAGTTLNGSSGVLPAGNYNLVLQYFPAIANVGRNMPRNAQAIYGGFALTDPTKTVTSLGGTTGAPVTIKLNNVPAGTTSVAYWHWDILTASWVYDGQIALQQTNGSLEDAITLFVTNLLEFIFGVIISGFTGAPGTGGL